MIQLPRYRSVKQVEAARIKLIEQADNLKNTRLTLEHMGMEKTFDVTPEWIDKHNPKVGGYFVQYDTGYQSYSPASEFERGNVLLEDGETQPFGPPLIISGFPGIGKSNLCRRRPELRDSDSSTFDKSQFPANYIEHIKTLTEFGSTILVSSHDVVRAALVENRMPFTLVYPALSQKDEYMDRYRKRGSPEPFLKLMDANWDTFIGQCFTQKGCHHYILSPGEYLADAYGKIRTRAENPSGIES